MCLTFVFVNPDPQKDGNNEYKLILAFNREERLDRPTAKADWWPDQTIFGGRDLVTGGTWLAADVRGRVAFVTNIQEPGTSIRNPVLTRGSLVVDFLSQDSLDAEAFMEKLMEEIALNEMKAFNFCIMEPKKNLNGYETFMLSHFANQSFLMKIDNHSFGVCNNPFIES